MRNTLDAILYINRTGAQWRYLPEKYRLCCMNN
jgi:transposase